MTKKELATASRDCTINLHKRCHKTQFKFKTTKAVREIKRFAEKNMQTKDNRISVELNQFIWKQGVRGVPRRVRVRLERKKNEDEKSGEKFYTEVNLINVRSFKNLLNENTRN